MIKIDHITESFGPIKAVDNLFFEIKKGEIVCFLGPNGGGEAIQKNFRDDFNQIRDPLKKLLD